MQGNRVSGFGLENLAIKRLSLGEIAALMVSHGLVQCVRDGGHANMVPNQPMFSLGSKNREPPGHTIAAIGAVSVFDISSEARDIHKGRLFHPLSQARAQGGKPGQVACQVHGSLHKGILRCCDQLLQT